MTTPPRRIPAPTQIATRVRVGKVCAAESVEAGDEGAMTGGDALLVSNDYGSGQPNSA